MANEIKYFVSPLTTDKYLSHNINCMNAFPFDKISDDELVSDLDKHKTHTSVLDKIHELNNLSQDEDRDDGSILTDIDPDLNMLYNMNDIIINSSRYFDNSTFRTTFNKYKNTFPILNANIRGVCTNLDKFKLLLDYLDYTFPIIGLTETWLKPHNVDCFFIKGYSHEYNIRPKITGGGVSLFIADSLIFTRRNDIKFNSIFNSIIIDIDKTELNSKRNVSIIIIYGPPNTESLLFINELDRILTALNKENRDIFLIGDFNYDTYKSSIYQSNNVNSENFTNTISLFTNRPE